MWLYMGQIVPIKIGMLKINHSSKMKITYFSKRSIINGKLIKGIIDSLALMVLVYKGHFYKLELLRMPVPHFFFKMNHSFKGTRLKSTHFTHFTRLINIL